MGLFSKMRAATAAPKPGFEIAKAVLAPAMLTSAADGSISDSEKEQLINICMFSPIFGPLGAQGVVDVMKASITDLKTRGAEVCIQEAASQLSPELRETAIAFAIRAALADGVLEEAEKNALYGSAQRFGVTPERFGEIFDVLAILQRRAA